MNLSAFDQVERYVIRLRNLQEAREAVLCQHITVTATKRVGDGRIDLADLAGIGDCRRVLRDLIDQHIIGVNAALKTYNVDVDN